MNTGQGNAYIKSYICLYCGVAYTGFHSCSSQSASNFAYCGKHNTYYNGASCSVCAAVATETVDLHKQLANLDAGLSIERMKRKRLERRLDNLILDVGNLGYTQNRDDEHFTARCDALRDAIGHASVRIDLAQAQLDGVADQADRMDGAQTELESRLLDIEAKQREIEERLSKADSLFAALERWL